MRPLIGYNYSVGEKKRVHKFFAYTLYLNLGIMLFGTILWQICPDTLIALFSSNPDTVNAGALEGLGKETPSLVISLCRYTLVIIPAAFMLSWVFGAVRG